MYFYTYIYVCGHMYKVVCMVVNSMYACHVRTHEKELKFTRYSIVQDQDTPLHRAAFNGHSGTARVLVEAKADVDAGNKVGMCGRGRGWMGSWGGRLCHE